MKKYFAFLTIFLLIIIFSIPSCEEKLAPEDFASDISIVPIQKVTYHSADLYWSEYDGEDFDRYEIYYKSINDKDYILYGAIKLVKQTFTTIYGLNPKTIYYFYIKAIDSKGNFKVTTPFQVETLSDEPAPFTLRMNQNEVTYNSARITWTGYKDFNIVDFWKYEVYYSSTTQYFVPAKENLFDSIKIITDTTRTINILSENTNYYFKVRTYNILGKFSESNSTSIKTLLKPPDTVYLYNPTEVTETYAIIKWTKTQSKYNPKYVICYGEAAGFNLNFLTRITFSNTGDTVALLSNLKRYGEYFAWVQVSDNRNLTSLSNRIDFTATKGGMPVPVTLSAGAPDRTKVILEWTPALSKYPVQPPEGYPYSVYMDTYPNFEATNNNGILATDASRVLISNLNPNTTYYFKVLFITIFSKYSYSNEVKVTTLP